MDLDWVHLDSSIAYDDSEVFHLLLVEFALLGFKKKVVVLEFSQDVANFLFVCVKGACCGNQDVVHVDYYIPGGEFFFE